MRRTPHGWSGLRRATFVMGLCTLMAHQVNAAPIEGSAGDVMTPLTTTATATTPDGQTSVTSRNQYFTSGTIDATGVTGQGIIDFRGIDAGQPGDFQAPSAFSLGTFVVGALAEGQSTTYTRTPFSITFNTLQVDGIDPVPNETPMTLTGVLDGTITGATQSDVVATFDPIGENPFQTGAFLNTLSLLDPHLSLVPSTTNGGRTTAQARLVVAAAPGAQPVPEPASIVVFLAALGGLALHTRSRRGR